MVEKRIIEQLDACRSGHPDDLNLPEVAEAAELLRDDPRLSELFGRLQAFDSGVRAALDEVPVPSNLADRLVARLQVTGQADPPRIKSLENSAPLPIPTPSRRVVLAATVGSVAGVAASILVALALSWFRGPSELTLENWPDSAEQWYQQVLAFEPRSWESSETAPGDYPISDRLLFPAQSWHRFRCPIDRSAVAYDFTPPESNQRATLMVVQATVPGLESSPPDHPAFFTQGRSLTAWQAGDLLYVLVVEGDDPSLYRDLIDSSTSPLAFFRPRAEDFS